MTKKQIIAAIVALAPKSDVAALEGSSVEDLNAMLLTATDAQANTPAEFDYKGELSKASKLEDEKALIYEGILERLATDGVTWDVITDTLRDNHLMVLDGSEWPIKTTLKCPQGKPVGIQAAIKAGHAGAIWLNRFNVYRSRYSGYNILKETPAPVTPDADTAPPVAGTEEPLTAPPEEAATDNKTDAPIVVNKKAIPAFLKLLMADITTTAQADEKEMLKDALLDLAAFYKVQIDNV